MSVSDVPPAGGSSEMNMSDEGENLGHKYTSLSVFEEPLLLIENGANGVFTIVEDVLDQISQIELTVNVIAITGPYRSGKSYLMNRLANARHGFPVGNGVKSETKGVWAWCLMHPVHKDQVLLLLDTEGIGDTEKEDSKNDNNLLCIISLICSTFIYNLKGVIDRDTLDKLGFVTFFANNIQVSKEKAQTAFSSDIGFYLPKFVLCLRDFSHDLGEQSPNEYLESQLTLQRGNLDQHEYVKYNQVRGCIRKFFVDRACFVFDAPAAGRKALASLESMSETDLIQSFKEDAREFIEHIYAYLPKQQVGLKRLNGNMFTCLMKIYVDKINSGGIPCIQDALSTMASQENRIIVKQVVNEFKLQIREIQLPVYDLQNIQEQHREVQRLALRRFRKKCILTPEDELIENIEENMHVICKKSIDSNIKMQKEQCKSALKEKYDSCIKKRLNEDHYKQEDGYLMFKKDINDLKSYIKERFIQMDETLLRTSLNDFENDILDDKKLAMQMTQGKRRKLKDEHEKEKTEIYKKLDRQFKDDQEKIEQMKVEIERERQNEIEANKKEMNELMKIWHDEKKLHTKVLEEQDAKIETLMDLLKKETKANEPSAGKTIGLVASSLFPIIGPAIFDAVERITYSKRKQERDETLKDCGVNK